MAYAYHANDDDRDPEERPHTTLVVQAVPEHSWTSILLWIAATLMLGGVGGTAGGWLVLHWLGGRP